MNEQKAYVVGTRDSQLAMWQANFVEKRLKEKYPQTGFTVVGMKTMGDVNLAASLSSFSSKGVFTKELDVALLAGRIDLAVHCMKDLPTTLPTGIVFGCVLPRGDVEDALIVHNKYGSLTLDTLPKGAVVGTSALRRIAVLSQHYRHLRFKDVRGNVNTRLKKLDSGEYDALILARVGLKRLGFGDRITQVLDADTFGYAVGQGALAVVCRESDSAMRALLLPLDDILTSTPCTAERALLRSLEGGCKVPIAVRSSIIRDGNALQLHASVISVDGERHVSAQHTVTLPYQLVVNSLNAHQMQALLEVADALGVKLGVTLKEKGADSILDAIKGNPSHPAPAAAHSHPITSTRPTSTIRLRSNPAVALAFFALALVLVSKARR
jgi:hydroxymethylbilane synthase